MHLNAVWMAPLIAGGVGAVALAAVAALVRRDVSELQKSMRPLRVPVRPERRRPPQQP